ncbi:unnamed protein product [Dicrocoelium dendriticum]|nr:unnamed protein product [Dicrocoelium dendriticum]
MSQVNSASATVNSIATPWNRTPGKPGVGSGTSNALSSLSSSRWSGNKASTIKRDQPAEDRTDRVTSGNPDSNTQMWPSLFESTRISDSAANAFSANSDPTVGTNQWSLPALTGTVGSNSLLGAPGSSTPCSNAWSINAPAPNCSVIPRAITGHHSIPASDSDSTRRYLTGTGVPACGGNGVGWPLCSAEPSDLLNDDTSHLSLTLSKMNINSALPPASCFQPSQEFTDGQLLSSNAKQPDTLPDTTSSQKSRNRSSTDNTEIEALFSLDPEETLRSMVNTSQPWGLALVDQGTTWDTIELAGDSGNTEASPVSDATNTSSRAPGSHSGTTFDGPGSGGLQQRRIVPPLTGSTIGRDLESNIWPSEPPNGTGIWESHYESLGERTARWQQNIATSLAQPGFSIHSANGHQGLITCQNPPCTRPQLSSGSDNGALFRGFTRSTAGLFPNNLSTATGCAAGLGPRPVLGAPHQVGASLHNTPGAVGSSRGFPLTSAPSLVGPGGAWPFPTPVTPTDNSLLNKGRWPNSSFARATQKQQQLPQSGPAIPHLLSGQSGNGLRWPQINNLAHIPSGWPLSDPRRPNLVSGTWAGSPSGDGPNYYGQPQQPMIPSSRMCQPGSVVTDFPPPMSLHSRGAGAGAITSQTFRPPHSAFYPTMNSAFPPSSSSAAHRMFLSPQQYSQQLQQQSVLRANAMRHLVNLGFPDDEIQAIFSDINTNVERALMDLRDRTCHPGLDDLIKSFTTGGLMQMNHLNDEALCSDFNRPESLSGGGRPLAMRGLQNVHKNAGVAGGSIPTENLEFSLHLLQQRETQILQAIMQLQSKHQELNQKLNQIRSANLPFSTNPVMQELQLQAIQVASQIDAQHTQLKQVRSQAGLLKQITMPSTNFAQSHNPPATATATTFNPISSNSNSAFTLLTTTSWPSGTSNTGTQQQITDGIGGGDHTVDSAATTDQSLKMGSGAFLWESNPWSGPTHRGSADPCSSNIDRRWSSAGFPNRPPYGALGDPRWADLGVDSGGNLLACTPQRPSSDIDLTSMAGANGNQRFGVSRSWLLAHNIPPHVTVGVLKLAVSTALMKHAKLGDTQPDFELHPNMSSRWVLIGLSSPSEAAVVQECLEDPGGNSVSDQGGAHYGAIKAISPADALMHLQEIQSLASRFNKPFGNSDTSTGRSTAQSTNHLLNYAGSTDLGSGNVESTNAMLNVADVH